jgi:hypothetical protein
MPALIWDFGSPLTQAVLGGTPAPASHPGATTQSSIDELKSRIDRLSMICCAMWTVIQSQAGVSDEDLISIMRELDLSDGREDGRANIEQVGSCSQCMRPVATRHLKCLYCGAPRGASNPFEGVL